MRLLWAAAMFSIIAMHALPVAICRLLLAPRFHRAAYRATRVMLYALAGLLCLLVIYLFYAVIHPERF